MEPCIPTLAARPPSGADWVHEIKHDGCWVIIRRAASGLLGERHARLAKLVSLLSERPPRSQPSWTDRRRVEAFHLALLNLMPLR